MCSLKWSLMTYSYFANFYAKWKICFVSVTCMRLKDFLMVKLYK